MSPWLYLGRTTDSQSRWRKADCPYRLAVLADSNALGNLGRSAVVAVTNWTRRDGASTCTHTRHRTTTDCAEDGIEKSEVSLSSSTGTIASDRISR